MGILKLDMDRIIEVIGGGCMLNILSVNLLDIEELNYIKKLCNDLTNSTILNSYKIDRIELQNNALNYSNEIYKKIINENPKLINDIENTILEKKDKTFDELDSDIIGYIYWKYNNKSSKVRASKNYIKKLFGINNISRLEDNIKPYELTVKCKKCKENAKIYIYDYEIKRKKFKCDHCGHFEEIKYNYSSEHEYIHCNCDYCTKIKQDLYLGVKNNIRTIVTILKCKMVEEYEGDYIDYEEYKILTEEEKLEDYKLYNSKLGSEEMEILSYKPKNKEELFKVINNIQNRNKNLGLECSDLKEKLISKKIIYEIVKVKDKKELIDNIFYPLNDVFNIRPYEDRFSLEKLIFWFENCTYEEFYDSYKEGLRFEINNEYIEFYYLLSFEECIVEIPKFLRIKDIELNENYFIEENMNIDKTERIKKLLKTMLTYKQKKLYLSLKVKYNEFLIIPNMKSYQFIRMNKIKIFFEEDDYKYLKNYNFDFVIFDFEGVAFKVIEMKKNSYSEEGSWHRDEILKIKLLSLVGLQYEELL